MKRQPIRARIWSTACRSARCRPKCGHYTWHYAVLQGETVVLYDNTGSYPKMLRAALIRVEALRHMAIAGHKLKAYRGHIG